MSWLSADHVNEIAEILYRWYPCRTLLAENGYGGHALVLLAVLRRGDDVCRIASRLGGIRTKELGLPPDPDSDRETARQLVHWWDGRREDRDGS